MKNLNYSEKLNYTENIEKMVLNLKSKAKNEMRTAFENYWNIKNDDELKQIIFREHVFKETGKKIWDNEQLHLINRERREQLVRWIVKEGWLEITYFLNDNKDNSTAMAMIDFIMSDEYVNRISNMEMNIF